jgi:UDP-N-acetylmuramoyl-L-alanyl-D-glutamate--2,6-diaminopimelate ligase
MNLQVLLEGIASCLSQDLIDLPVQGLVLDSRLVVVGDAFIALHGSQQHGLVHAQQAIKQGAAVIIYDPAGNGDALAQAVLSLPTVAIPNLAHVLGDIAARFYGYPSQQMAVIGITGTNGKTSCSQFMAQMLNACGIIGTLGWGEWGHLAKTVNTTPDALAVQRMLACLQEQGKQTVAMEVSSHGLAQGRVNGVEFAGAVFTNITRDHLDYHGTMEAYLDAKLSLLKYPGLAFVVVNLDADYSDRIVEQVPGASVIWGISRQGKSLGMGESLLVTHSKAHSGGLEFTVSWRSVSSTLNIPLYGDFNVENVLLVLAVMLAMGEDFQQATVKLQQLKPVAGRMECFGGRGQPLVFVDYAHTPDALDNVLQSARHHCQQTLAVVFGCGGNRDSGKRTLMGASASRWADKVIVTDDNPRFENGTDIINAILTACEPDKTQVIADREHAIHQAIADAAPGDCIVIAGKGHENYQEINGVQYPFSDKQIVLEALARRA